MSLYKQLWLAVVFLLAVIFVGILVVSSLSSKSYLEQQLYMKNSDNAAALALSLTQQDADPVLLELTLSAQFDTGHYELIQLTDPAGEILLERKDDQQFDDAPAWFMQLLPIHVDAGVAQIQQGWHQLGTLSLRSHSRFAYRELWNSTKKMAGVFLVGMLLAGSLGSYLLRIILRPLDDVVDQAEAIGNRRFVTIEEPATLEFRKLVKSMNTLSQRIKAVLQQEAKQLEKLQRDAHVDRVTGLLQRTPFMRRLSANLERDDASASGMLSIIRISGLAQLNQSYGHKRIDSLLGEIGAALTKITTTNSSWSAGRLNGSDFAILAPREIDADEVAKTIQQLLTAVFENSSMEAPLPCAVSPFRPGDTIGTLMTQLDAALISSEQEGESAIAVANRDSGSTIPVRQEMEEWTATLTEAFAADKFSLASFPVSSLDGGLIHIEAPVRLRTATEELSAGLFLPWVNRLEMAGDLDRQVIGLALDQIARDKQPVCINLSVSSVKDPGFITWIRQTLSKRATDASYLWMEVQEAMAFRHLEEFKLLSAAVSAHDCKIGIEHVGDQLTNLGQLHDCGLDYLKVDSALIRDIHDNPANQTLLRTLCTVGHSVGLTVIAEGVQKEEEWHALAELGLDGATGPEVTRQSAST